MMKRIWMLLLLSVIAWGTWAQNTEVRTPGSFRGIKVSEGIDVYLTKGSKESVKVVATGTSTDRVLTEISGTFLRIHMADGHYRGQTDVKVYVTYVALEKLMASSAGTITTEDVLKVAHLDISASSAAQMELAIDADKVNVSVSSAAEVELEGKCRELTADASSAGEVSAFDLEVSSAVAGASSGAEVKVKVNDSLVANASSGGSVRYRGLPEKFMVNSSSGGSVRRAD